MAKELTMPKMGYDMEEGTLAKWLKQPGDTIERGEPIAEVETDKVTIEIEAFDGGTLQKLVVQEGETVPVGAVIALIDDGSDDDDDDDDDADTATPEPSAAPEKPAEAAQGSQAVEPTQGQKRADAPSGQAHAQAAPARKDGARIFATPAARRVAEDRGVDLAGLQGSGPDGRIVRADVEGAQAGQPAAQPAAPTQRENEERPAQVPTPAAAPTQMPAEPVIATAGATEQPLSRLRQTIATRMVQSQQQVPPFFVTAAIEMDAALDLLPKLQEAHGGKLSVTELLLKACAKALLKYPELNATFAGDKLIVHQGVHISVAVATDAGLLAPVVRDVDKLSLGAVSAAMRAVIRRTRESKATLDDLQGGTFTISNLGMFDVAHFVAIITPPQSSILAVGSTIPTPVVRDGEIVIRQMMNVTISVDHRVSDGATAAQFLQELRTLMENPYKLVL